MADLSSNASAMNASLPHHAISRGEELLGRAQLDWTIERNWAADTVEALKATYGDQHHKVKLFEDAGRPGAVRRFRRGPPPNPTPAVNRRIATQLSVLREFARELEGELEKDNSALFGDAARARLWHVLTDLFPPHQYDHMGEIVTQYQEDLERVLMRGLDTVRLADGRTVDARLKSFVLSVADEATLNRLILLIPEAYVVVHQIESHERERLMPVCVSALNAYLESIGHERRIDERTYELAKPGLDTSPPKGFRSLPNRIPCFQN